MNFDFGESSPDPEKLNPQLFSIRWEGSVFAADTGEYEFIVRSEHGTQLWINDLVRPLIDAPVRSKNDTESRATIFLLLERHSFYPVKLDFVKIIGQEDDSERGESEASVGQGFGRTLMEAPAADGERHTGTQPLADQEFLERFVCVRRFPADDRSVGLWIDSPKAWDQAATAAAVETGYVSTSADLAKAGNDPARPHEDLAREFCLRFAERAFGRPLSDAEADLWPQSAIRPA